MPPRGWLKAVGPTGPSADQGGRPATQWRQPPPIYWVWAVLGLLLSECWGNGCASILGLLLVRLSMNQCSDIFCDFMSGQSVVVTCILAPKHNFRFLKGKVWFRDLIG